MHTVRPMTPFCPGIKLSPQHIRGGGVELQGGYCPRPPGGHGAGGLKILRAGTGFTPGLQGGLLFKSCDLTVISKV